MSGLDDLGSAVSGGVSSLGNLISGGANKKAGDANQAAIDAYNSVNLPTAADLKLQLTQLVNNGNLTPEQAQVYLENPSAMSGITLDPRLKQAQMEALASLQDIGQNKGLTDMDRAQLAQIQTGEDTAARGAREAILNNADARGMGGSGASLLAQLQNSQDAATRQSARDTSVAGMAQQRALQAIQSAGSLGGQIGNQEFGQKADVAKANDAINQFNTANRNQIGLYNTGQNNQAQQYNLNKEMDVNKLNTGIANQQAAYNAGVPNTMFQQQIAKAGGIAGANQAAAQGAQAQGAANRAMIGSITQGVAYGKSTPGGGGAASGGGAEEAGGAGAEEGAAAASDKNLKTNIKGFDASAFLDSLTPSKFNYKEPEKFGKGPQIGVMAQDVEKKAPQMVEDTPEGKMIDYNKAGGPLFASLASIHQRLKKLEGK